MAFLGRRYPAQPKFGKNRAVPRIHRAVTQRWPDLVTTKNLVATAAHDLDLVQTHYGGEKCSEDAKEKASPIAQSVT